MLQGWVLFFSKKEDNKTPIIGDWKPHLCWSSKWSYFTNS